MGDKVDGGLKAEVEQAITSLKAEIQGENSAAIKQLSEALSHVSHKLAASAYQQASPGGQTQGAYSGGVHGSSDGSASGVDEGEVVDAEYEEVQ